MKNLRYIGPFFRMNSLSEKEINGQLFYLSKEAVKTIVLNSRCGLVSQIKKYNKLSSSIDITTNSNFSPLLCVYRKASPTLVHSKNSNGFDEDSFKKEINPSTNALMTLSMLELLDYYRSFKDIDNSLYSIYELYKSLSKDQLEFYSINLRNTEGVFTEKKNLLENNSKNFNLIDKDKKFKFSDQAFMMLAYFVYSKKNNTEEVSKAYYEFSLEILSMFSNFKENVYECSLDEICKILLVFNILYSYEELPELNALIIDFADYAICKFDEKDYYINSLDVCSLCSIVLSLSYKHTHIISFLDKSTEIIERLYTLYDEDKGTFYKLSTKKEIKYSCTDITFYFLAFVIYGEISDTTSKYKDMILSIYKKFLINSRLIPSWPSAPTLDDFERYRGFSLNSADMIDESFFRMPDIPTPESTGIAPIFNKSLTYNRKKDTFSCDKVTFDSYKNFLNFYMFIHFFKDEYIKDMNLTPNIDNSRLSSININDEGNPTDINTTNIESNDSLSNNNDISSSDTVNLDPTEIIDENLNDDDFSSNK